MKRTLILLCSLTIFLGACARTQVTDSIETNFAPTDGDSAVAYWHKLPERSAITNNEGLHGLLETVLGEDPSKNWDDRLLLARDKGLVPAGFSGKPDETMTRGTLAVGLARTLNVKGGLMMQLSKGGSARYATRELSYMGLLPEGSTENQSISGIEYVGIMSKAQDWLTLAARGRMK